MLYHSQPQLDESATLRNQSETAYLLRRVNDWDSNKASKLQATRLWNNRDAQHPQIDPQRGCEIQVDDAERGILGAEAHECNMRSKFRWFAEFCNSHYVSHFAAFFIVARAKISTVKSFRSFRFRTKATNTLLARRSAFVSSMRPHTIVHKQKSLVVDAVVTPLLLARSQKQSSQETSTFRKGWYGFTIMILPQVHLRKPCYDFYFL